MTPPLGGSKTDATTTATVTGAAKACPACRAAVLIVAAQAGAAPAGGLAGATDVVAARFAGEAVEEDETITVSVGVVVVVFTGGISVTEWDGVNVA